MLIGAAGSCALAAPPPRRPNIVFILVDDLRWNALGCMGHPFSKTPNIDRIAHEGALFNNTFVTTSLCSPSRASFLTGRYIHSHGVLGNGDNNELSHRLITWPRLLHDSGYETAFCGKWHMGNDDTPRPGFDRWVSFKGQGQYNDPQLNIDGERVTTPGYITDILTGHAVNFLKKPHSKPFTLYLAHKAVHGPFTPAERHKDLYTDAKIEHRPNVYDTLEGKPVLQRTLQAGKQGKQKQRANAVPNHDNVMLNQLRCLAAIDESTGRVLQTLKETGRLDDTLIMFSSDNGYLWGEHGLGDKRACYEESMRIPMVARYPKMIQPGSSIQKMVLNVDVCPTMLELAGVKAPPEVRGESMVRLLQGDATGWRKSFFMEYFQEANFARIPTWQGIRNERWKYAHYPEIPGADELYDLEADTYEMKNMINDPKAQEILKDLQAETKRRFEETK